MCYLGVASGVERNRLSGGGGEVAEKRIWGKGLQVTLLMMWQLYKLLLWIVTMLSGFVKIQTSTCLITVAALVWTFHILNVTYEI